MKREFRDLMVKIIDQVNNQDISCIETIIKRAKEKRNPPRKPQLYGKCEDCHQIDFLEDQDGFHYCHLCRGETN